MGLCNRGKEMKHKNNISFYYLFDGLMIHCLKLRMFDVLGLQRRIVDGRRSAIFNLYLGAEMFQTRLSFVSRAFACAVPLREFHGIPPQPIKNVSLSSKLC